MSVLLSTLSMMLHLALPHINVLSKIDLAEKFGKLHFGLDFYTEVSPRRSAASPLRRPMNRLGTCYCCVPQ